MVLLCDDNGDGESGLEAAAAMENSRSGNKIIKWSLSELYLCVFIPLFPVAALFGSFAKNNGEPNTKENYEFSFS
jgi:hypothetical protein